jgi:chemotaxis response regulator CheB
MTNGSGCPAPAEVFDRVGILLSTSSSGGAGIKDLMARMGHDSERAALIYQHEARGAEKMITDTIDAHVEAEQGARGDDDGPAGVLVPVG